MPPSRKKKQHFYAPIRGKKGRQHRRPKNAFVKTEAKGGGGEQATGRKKMVGHTQGATENLPSWPRISAVFGRL